jgi:integrase
MQKGPQLSMRNSEMSLIEIKEDFPDTIDLWIEAYFKFEVSTAKSSRKVQRRDLNLFHEFMLTECPNDKRPQWTPRLCRSFKEFLQKEELNQAKRRYGDRTVNRIMAHLKTFAKWIHKYRPFPLGNPMEKIKLLPVGSGLEIERAITPAQRRRILDAADRLPTDGGRSKDRHRFRNKERPQHKSHRPYRNRAIVYTLIETGMRRAAATKLNLKDVNFKQRILKVEEKGGAVHGYKITREGLAAIQDYIDKERGPDFDKWQSPALFLPSLTRKSKGRISPIVVNSVWNDVNKMAGVEGKTPHSARHAVGKHIIEKTGNIAAVQRQLGHKNAAYSMQYARITDEELGEVLENR